MAGLSKKQRRYAQDVALVGGALYGAERIYKAGKEVVKTVKTKIEKRKAKKAEKKELELQKQPQVELAKDVIPDTVKEKQQRSYDNNTYKEGK